MIYLLGFMSGLAGGQGSRISAVNVAKAAGGSGGSEEDHGFAGGAVPFPYRNFHERLPRVKTY